MVDGKLWTGRSEQWRVVLALLAMNAGVIVSYDTLAEALWGNRPPANREKALQSCVERLQARLGPDGPGILNHPGIGYSLDVSPEEVDVLVFVDRCKAGRELAGCGTWTETSDVLREALELRRAAPFLDIDCPALEAQWSQYLQRLWIQALQDRTRAYLHLSRHEDVIPRLEGFVWEHPGEELFWALLMLAQYRSGRRRDANATYDHAVATLKREVGAEPGEIIESIQRQIAARVPAAEIPVP